MARLLAIVVLSCACTDEVAIRIEIETNDLATGAVTFELVAFAGTAPPELDDVMLERTRPVRRVVFDAGSPAALGVLPEGSHRVAVLVRDAACAPLAFGTAPLEVGSQERVVVRLEMATASAPYCGGAGRCSGGRCGASDTDGGPDARPDGGVPDGAPDADVPDRCTMPAECGSPFLDCVSERCTLREPTVETIDELDAAAESFLGIVSLAITDESDGAWAHVGHLPVSTGGNDGVITSVPLADFSDVTARRRVPIAVENSLEDTRWISVAALEDDLLVALSGSDGGLPTYGHWVGTIRGEAGATAALTGINSDESITPVGPNAIVTGARGGARFVLRHIDSFGAAAVGSVDEGAGRKSSTELASPPEGMDLSASGSDGEWMVIEASTDGPLVFWRPDDERAVTRAPRSPGSTDPSLLSLGGQRLLFGDTAGGALRLVEMTCDASCDPAFGMSSTPTLPAGVTRVDLARSGDVAFAVLLTDTTPVRVELWWVRGIEDLRGPQTLLEVPSGEELHGIEVVATETEIVFVAAVHHVMRDRRERIAVVRASFP